MIASLVGLQGGHTKYSCFLCLWNNRADEQHHLVLEFKVFHKVTHLPLKKKPNVTCTITYQAWTGKAVYKNFKI